MPEIMGANEVMLEVTSSPHLRSTITARQLMMAVLIGLLPAALAGIIFFGINALVIMVTSVLTAVLAEALYQKLVGKPVTINDGSAAVTGLLLALNLPPAAPFWLPIVGSAFAIVVAKQLYGGLGHNFVNPALAARALLLAAWPLHMASGWLLPFDGGTSATPLAVLKGTAAGVALPGYMDLLVGNVAGCIGETSALALIIGGLYLVWREVIDWRIPAFFIGTVALMTWVFGGRNGPFTGDALANILAGGLMLGAFFMATDYVTSPMTLKGRVIMGIGCGVITSLIRMWGGYPEGVSYSILLMNLATPLIDRFTVPRPFGMVKARLRKA